MDFIKRNIRLGYQFGDSIERIEKWEYPILALRELLLNAIVHRDYPNLSLTINDKSKSTRVVVIHTKKQKKVGEKVGEDLTKNQLKIIDFINKNNKITAKQLAKKIKISDRKIEENIKKLKQISSPRCGYWELL